MPTFAELLQQGTAHAWLFVPSAILLGALHGLEPGHSKTMMAAFIVAIRGTVAQAFMLGIAATISHTAIVWGIAFTGMYLWRGLDTEAIEPYFQLLSAAIIISIAFWLLWRTFREQRLALAEEGHHHHDHDGHHSHSRSHDHDHGHDHGHHHHHHAEMRRIDTGHGVMSIGIFEDGVPPRWHIRQERAQIWRSGEIALRTVRRDGSSQVFAFVENGDHFESIDEIPEPHDFTVHLSLGHGTHVHDFKIEFRENEEDGKTEPDVIDLDDDGYQDAHERAHANEIRRRFKGKTVTNGQIVMFGLTGGLIPCPAAITVLLVCLQLKQISLGFVLVLCFSIGLALTLVTVGAAAALSIRHATARWSWFNTVARRAPYLSGLLIVAVGIYVGLQGWHGLATLPHA